MSKSSQFYLRLCASWTMRCGLPCLLAVLVVQRFMRYSGCMPPGWWNEGKVQRMMVILLLFFAIEMLFRKCRDVRTKGKRLRYLTEQVSILFFWLIGSNVCNFLLPESIDKVFSIYVGPIFVLLSMVSIIKLLIK